MCEMCVFELLSLVTSDRRVGRMTEDLVVLVAHGSGWLSQLAIGTLEHDDVTVRANGKVRIRRHHVVLADITTFGIVWFWCTGDGLVGLEGEVGLVDVDAACGEGMIWHVCLIIASESADVHGVT